MDIEREHSRGRAEAVAAMQYMASNNLRAFREDTRSVTRDVEQHTIPELTDVTPIPDATVNSGPDAETFPQELTNYTEEISSQRIPPMVYIDGNNCKSGLVRGNQNDETEENSQYSLNPETGTEQTTEQGPLSRRYTEPSVQAVITANSPTLQEYSDEDFSNVTSVQHGINSLSFNTLAANIDLRPLTSRNQPDCLENPVRDWIVPDGQNKKLRDHRNKSMSERTSPDGGPAMYINLSNLSPYFSSSNFLINMVTGHVLVLHKRRWIRTSLTCTQSQTPPEELGIIIQEASNMYWNKLIEKNETSLQRISNKDIRKTIASQISQVPTLQPIITAQPPPLPRIDNPELYTIHDELMPLQIRRTYIRDRTRNAHTCIMEYSATLEMIKERRYIADELLDWLRIVYGRVDVVRRNINESLSTDD